MYFEDKDVEMDLRNFECPSQEIQNDGDAARVMAQIRAVQHRLKRESEVAELEISRVKRWLSQREEHACLEEAHLKQLLERYYLWRKEADPKYALSTPEGSAGYKKQQAQWMYDDDLAIAYFQSRGMNDFLREKIELNKVGIKKMLKVVDGCVVDDNGEVVEGIQVVPQDERFVVRL